MHRPLTVKAWIKYAQWEASQNEFERSRSVFERALDVDPRSVELWVGILSLPGVEALDPFWPC